MGADVIAHTKPADLDYSYEDLPDAPLLPKDLTSSPNTAPTKSPETVQVDRDAESDSLGGIRQRKHGFQTDLCDCCAEPGGVELCCYGYLCAPCLFGRNVERLGPVRWAGEQAAPSVIPCWAAGLTFGVLEFLPIFTHQTAGLYLPWVLQMLFRRRLRKHYQIEGHSDCCSCGAKGCEGCCCKCNGDDCHDCCASFWCLPCALCQDAREITLREGGMVPTLPAAITKAPTDQDMQSS